MKKKAHQGAAQKIAKNKAGATPPEAAEAEPRSFMGVTEAMGSCRYADFSGNVQCESPVSKGYCDGKGGFWVENGRCN